MPAKINPFTGKLDLTTDTSTLAPIGATYITQTTNSTLTAEQALSALATGYMKSATSTGVVTTQAVPIPIADGGTNATSFTNTRVPYFDGTRFVDSAGHLWVEASTSHRITGTTAEQRLISSVDSNNTRLTRNDVNGKSVRYNTVAKNTNYSIQLDGTNDYISVPNSASISPTTTMSITAWIKITGGNGTFRHIIVKPSQATWGGVYAVYAFRLNDGDRLNAWLNDATVGANEILSNTSLSANSTWRFVAFTYDGSTLRLYIDGTQDNTKALSASISTSTQPLSIGTRNTTDAAEYFTGIIEDVHIYSRVLSAAEITTLYGGGQPSTTNLGLWLKFDENSGTSAADSSGNGNTGTLQNGAAWSSDVPSVNPGYTPIDVETEIWSSEDSEATINDESGIQTIGWKDGETRLQGKRIIFRPGTTPTERGRFHSDGQFFIGTRPADAFLQPITTVQQYVTNTGDWSILNCISSNGLSADVGSGFALSRSRGTLASPTAITNGDIIGEFSFKGYDGTTIVTPGRLTGYVDGTVSANTIPIRLSFETSTGTDANRKERLQIKNNGSIIINPNSDFGTTVIPLTLKASASHTANLAEWQNSAGTILLNVQAGGHLEYKDATNIVFGTTTGTKLGTGTTQKLGFYNATPVAQQASIADATGGVVIDAEARTAINALISRIEVLGLIATV